MRIRSIEDLRRVRSVVDRLSELGCLLVSLTGGEPLARADLTDLFADSWERKCAVSIPTKGLGCGPDAWDRCALPGQFALLARLDERVPACQLELSRDFECLPALAAGLLNGRVPQCLA
jgi:hypothetical protein